MKYAFLAGLLVLLIGAFMYFAETEEPISGTEVESTTEEAPEGAPEAESDNSMVAESEESTTDTAAQENDAESNDTETSNEVAVESSEADSTQEREFTLDSFMYGYSEDTIVVNEGDTVTINLTSSEGLHDWVVDEFAAATEIISVGDETSVTFVADQTGEFEFYCSVGNHRAQGMVGTLTVE